MVVDSSAFLAILLGEPEALAFRTALGGDATRLTSSASLLETTMVMLTRFGEPGAAELQALLRVADVQSAPFGPEHLGIAIDAFRRFGKGRHPAALNFGDCFSYALAKATGEPLLFKGDDFSRTDIKGVL
ncbi:MAG TPA: type II toxin-antitoxin system VapC family toxin [Lichenihabitans sp.]|jgi:ribonuclease VapC|nr:type II toxin-antitoxin system VapC family toxin [Lichenihabitans sp.]